MIPLLNEKYFMSQSRFGQIFYNSWFCISVGLGLFLLISSFLRANSRFTRQDLARNIQQIHNRFGVERNKAGILIRQLSSRDTLYEQNTTRRFVPASNMKIVSVGAAVEELGWDYFIETDLYLSSDKRKSNHPSLFIKGRGEPNISSRFYADHPTAIFEKWAKKLRENGVRRLSKLVLDDSFYSQPWIHPEWKKEDLPYWYAAPVGALNFNDNCVDLTVTPANTAGHPVRIEVRPSVSPANIHNRAKTVRRGERSWLTFTRNLQTWDMFIKGQFRLNGGARVESLTVPDPSQYFGSVLHHVLERQGITVEEGYEVKSFSADRPSIEHYDTFRSSLERSVRIALQRSQNLYAETLFKHLGAHRFDRGSWKTGRKVVRSVLSSHKIDVSELHIVDGSGLASQNRLTPRSIVRYLSDWKNDRDLRRLFRILPDSGKDGTMSNRLDTRRMKGYVAAKTGFLDGVHTLSGFIKKPGDTLPGQACQSGCLVFSVLLNDQDISVENGRDFCDAIAKECVRYMRDNR